jgi:hypothetical protein
MEFSMVPILKLELRNLTAQSFCRKFLLEKIPLQVLHMAAGWKALNWTETYLKTRLRHKRVKVSCNQASTFDYNATTTTGTVTLRNMSLGQALDLMSSERGSNYYIQQQDVQREFPELLSDIERPALLDHWRRIDSTNIWIGGGGCRTPLHYDSPENLLVQIAGRKKITLFPPEQSANLYPAIGEFLPNCSRVNAFAPDASRHPLFLRAEEFKTECILEPPDALFIPGGWWHAVESLEPAISLNFWWHSLI